MIHWVKNQGQKVSKRTFSVRLKLVLYMYCGTICIEIGEFSQNFAHLFGWVRHSQLSTAAKDRTTGSAILMVVKDGKNRLKRTDVVIRAT